MLELIILKIKEAIKENEELYNYYLEKLDNNDLSEQHDYFKDRLRELRVERMSYENVINMIEKERV